MRTRRACSWVKFAPQTSQRCGWGRRGGHGCRQLARDPDGWGCRQERDEIDVSCPNTTGFSTGHSRVLVAVPNMEACMGELAA